MWLMGVIGVWEGPDAPHPLINSRAKPEPPHSTMSHDNSRITGLIGVTSSETIQNLRSELEASLKEIT